MKIHEFFSQYANTPLSERFIPLNFKESGMQTLHNLYEEIKTLEDSMRPAKIREEELLERAGEFYKVREDRNLNHCPECNEMLILSIDDVLHCTECKWRMKI